ncbi:hypothetical protein, partial [Victivallis vadensis]|uniref:hypothetical protein n=1 Tax=Victivallis vadensis TaxID=172901 RepID=UPI00197D804D
CAIMNQGKSMLIDKTSILSQNLGHYLSSFWVMERWTLFSQRHRLSFMSGMRLVNNNPFLCILQGCPV